MNDQDRQAFEDWISAPPYELETERWPNDPTKAAWPGSYVLIDVDLAWFAFKQALAHRDAQHAEVMREVREVLEEIEDFIGIAHVHCDDNPIFGLGDSDLYTRRFYAADAAAARLREKVGEA